MDGIACDLKFINGYNLFMKVFTHSDTRKFVLEYTSSKWAIFEVIKSLVVIKWVNIDNIFLNNYLVTNTYLFPGPAGLKWSCVYWNIKKGKSFYF